MDRRLFVTGLLGVVGTTGIAAVLPRQAKALTAVPLGGAAPPSDTLLPELPKLPESEGPLGAVDEGWEPDEGEELYEGFQPAYHRRRHRRRRVRRWRRVCRRWWYNGHWRRRCRRRPHFIWLWFWV
jgi:hypothetical protein